MATNLRREEVVAIMKKSDVKWLVTWHPDRQTDAFYLKHADIVESIGFSSHRSYLAGAIKRQAIREAKQNG